TGNFVWRATNRRIGGATRNEGGTRTLFVQQACPGWRPRRPPTPSRSGPPRGRHAGARNPFVSAIPPDNSGEPHSLFMTMHRGIRFGVPHEQVHDKRNPDHARQLVIEPFLVARRPE